MRWLWEEFLAFAAALTDSSAVNPRAARGCYMLVLALGVIAGGLMAFNPAKFWWAPKALIGLGICFGVFLLFGLLALGASIARGSGWMGGRTGVMLKDLEEAPPEDPRRKKPPVRRKGDTVPEWKVRPRALAAEAVLDLLAEDARAVAPAKLVRWLEETVPAVRKAIEAEDLGPAAGRLTAKYRKALQAEIDDRAARGERRVFGKVSVLSARPLVVDAADPDAPTVTALITIKSRDYLADRKGRVLDGSKDELAVVQEFWVVRRDGRKWKVDRVRPSEEADEVCDQKSRLPRDRYEQLARTADRDVLAEVTAAG